MTTPTDQARLLLSKGLDSVEVAELTGLHDGYVRKIRQRDEGRDQAHQLWRQANPDRVLAWRLTQDRKRLLDRRARREMSA